MENEIENLQHELDEQIGKLNEGKRNKEILAKLFEDGIIDGEGNLR